MKKRGWGVIGREWGERRAWEGTKQAKGRGWEKTREDEEERDENGKEVSEVGE